MIEIQQIILARVLQMVKSPFGTLGYLPDLVRQLKDRYSFVGVPKDEDLLPSDPPKGAEFHLGKLVRGDKEIIVDRLTVWRDGIVADSTSSTDDMDFFVNDLAEWARAAAPKAIISGPHYYLSHLEIRMDKPLALYTPQLRESGGTISELLSSYGIATPRYETSVIHLYFDIFGKGSPVPGLFSLERRQNAAWSENLWFSQAPLKTSDHFSLLRALHDEI